MSMIQDDLNSGGWIETEKEGDMDENKAKIEVNVDEEEKKILQQVMELLQTVYDQKVTPKEAMDKLKEITRYDEEWN